MIITHQKEKAFNAITYFLEHTSLCYKKKLYKLLFLLDFEHFHATGRNVTGFEYSAWDMGPVPVKLDDAIDTDNPDFTAHIDVQRRRDRRGKIQFLFESKDEFNPKRFSKREFRILQSIADRFELMTGDEMEAYTHREGTPWHKVYVVEDRRSGLIPYEYALDDLGEEDRQIITELARERAALLANYQ